MAEPIPSDGQHSLAEVLESIADPVVAFDKQWRYTFVSRRAAQFLGKVPEEMIGKSMWELFPEDANTGFQEACQRAWREGKPVTVERYSKALNMWVESFIYPFENGASTQWRDITERKRATEALSESEAILRSFFDSPGVMRGVVTIVDGRIVHVSCNDAAAKMYGVGRESVSGNSATEAGAPEEVERAWAGLYEESRRSGKPVSMEYSRRDADGRERWLLATAAYLGIERSGNPRFAYTILDLTDRKRAEEALRQSESQLRSLGDNLPEAAIYQYRHDVNGEPHVDFISAGIERLTGVPAAEFMRDAATVERWIVPEDHDRMNAAIALSRERLTRLEVEARRRHRVTGETRWSLFRATPTRNPDGSTTWHGIELDITGRKQAEEAVRESQSRLEAVFAAIPYPLVEFDATGKAVRANEAALRAAGIASPAFTADQFAAKLQFGSLDGNAVRAEELPASRALRDEKATGDLYSVRTADGIDRVVCAYASPVYKDGNVTGVVALWHDVTELKRAEEALRESRAKLQAALASMADAVSISDAEGRFIDFNDAFATFHRFRSKGECSRTFAEYPDILDVFLPDGTLAPLDGWAAPRALRGEVVTNAEYALRRKDTGETWTGSFSFGPIRDKDGVITGSVVVARDITSRKLAEEALRASEFRNRFLAGLLERAGQPFAVGNPDGGFGFVNPAFEHLTGYSRDELQGMDWAAALTPPEWLEVERAKLEELHTTGRPVRYEREIFRKDRTRVPVELLVHLATDDQGRRLYYAFLTDLTERRRAAEALRNEREWLQVTLSSIGDAVLATDAAGKITFLNPVAAGLTGWTQEQALGQPARDVFRIVNEQTREEGENIVGRVLREMRVVPLANHTALVSRDGREIPVEDSAAPIIDAAGNVLGVVLVFHDVTGQRRAQDALHESEAQFRTLANSIPQLCWIANADGWIYWYNQRWYEYTGTTPEQMEGWGWQSVHDPKTLPRVLEHWKASIATGEPFDMVFPLRGADGIFRPFLTRVMPVRDRDGKIVRWFGTNTDITEHRKTEEALRHSREQLHSALQASNTGTWRWDIRTGEVEWYENCGRLFGLPSGRKLQSTEEFLAFVHPDDRAAVAADVQRCAAQGVDFDRDFRVVWADGSVHWLVDRGTTYFDDEGKPAYMTGACVDITERTRAEEHLRQAQKLESLGLLAGGVAHDFNNLLVGVIGNASLAKEFLPPNHAAGELLDGVIRSGEQAAHLTRQMLAYSGKGKFVVEALNLSALVPEASELVRPSISKKTSLRLDLEENLPAIEADRGQVHQVFMNLVLNAAEAVGSHDGLITVRTGVQNVDESYLRLHPEAADLRPGEHVFLEVRDTGCGMDDATRARIFDPFFSTKFTGRGLGLAAVAGIMRGHKGAIIVDSAPGRGSCFTVLFPAAAHASAERQVATRNVALDGSGVVLVVDDEPVVREMAKRGLERHGYTVLLADSGLAAIDVFKRHPGEIALVILDLSMPDMSGEEVLPELRKVRPEVRVMVSSGYNESEALVLFQGQRVSGFIQKPYTSGRLAGKVKSVLG